MSRFPLLVRSVVAETCSVVLTAGGCALGIAGLLVTTLHVCGLVVGRFDRLPDELMVSIPLLLLGLLLALAGRRLRP